MEGYKAFENGLICRGKQYAENTDFEEPGADECCRSGVMHYCKEPFDVWKYYPVVGNDGNFTEYAEVEPLGYVLEDGDKCATNKLHIGAKLNLKDFITAEIDFILEKAKGKSAAQGYFSRAAAQGDSSSVAAQGYYSSAAAQGDSSSVAAQGDHSSVAAQGDCSRAAAQGDHSSVAANGLYSIAAGLGIWNKAKSKIGSWLVLAEWERVKDTIWKPVCVKSAQIDGEILKPDTWYMLKNGEFVEVGDDD